MRLTFWAIILLLFNVSCIAAQLRTGHLYDDIGYIAQFGSAEDKELASYYEDLFKTSEGKGSYRGVLLISHDIPETLSKEDKDKFIAQYALNKETQLGSILIMMNPKTKTLHFITTKSIDEKRLKDENFFNAPIEKFKKSKEVKLNMVLYFIGMLHLYLTGEYA